MRGGHNKKPVIWKGEKFESMAELASKLSITRTSVCESCKNGHKVKGHYVKEIK